VRIAREVIEKHVRREPLAEFQATETFQKKSGVFVTIETYPKKDLRGCIGFPEPHFKLINAIKSAAKSAATEDPRFPPVSPKELDKIVIEVSLLTNPELIKVNSPKDYIKQVVIGRDGLIIERGFSRGLLLPQVPIEWKWDAEEFLAQICYKAGLPPDTWLEPATKLYRFTAEIFAEEKPRGEIVPHKLTDK